MRKRGFKNIYEIPIILTALLSLTYVTSKLFNNVYEIQPTSYIDEIFHIPQAQLYCTNTWNKWNPKITTLPGLYLISYIFLKPLEILDENFCSIYSLRTINFIGTVINFLLSYLIMSNLHNISSTKSFIHICRNVVSAVNIAIFPVLYFFTFLYYTDVWSTTFVLLMYYGHISLHKGSKFLTAISGMVAVLIRQTNIIWVGFMIMNDAWKIFTKNMKSKKHQDLEFTIVALKSLRIYFPSAKCGGKKQKTSNIFHLVKEIMITTYPSLGVCVFFVLFLIVNGGIVVGDKTAHSAVLHPMQNLYFLDFSAFFGLPYFIIHVISRKRMPNVYIVLLLSCFAVVLSEVNKLEHPYLLADNRHLAFYIWKRIFGHDLIRRVVTLTYAVAGIILFDLLEHCHFMFKGFLAFCIIFNLSLQYLFELRYFIIPYIMIRLHFRQNISVWLEFIFFSVVNAFIIYIFLNKPFSWDSEPDAVQRFIW